MNDEAKTAAAAALYFKLSQELLARDVPNTVVGVAAIGNGVDVLRSQMEPDAVALWLEGFAFALRTGRDAPAQPVDASRH